MTIASYLMDRLLTFAVNIDEVLGSPNPQRSYGQFRIWKIEDGSRGQDEQAPDLTVHAEGDPRGEEHMTNIRWFPSWVQPVLVTDNYQGLVVFYSPGGTPTQIVFSTVDRKRRVSYHIDQDLRTGEMTFITDYSGHIWMASPPDLQYRSSQQFDAEVMKLINDMSPDMIVGLVIPGLIREALHG